MPTAQMCDSVDCRTLITRKPDCQMLSNLRILVADDHEFQREIIASLLRRLGAQTVYTVNDGAAALKAIADPAHPVDIVVLDMAMPGMDGVELIRNLGAAGTPVALILNSSFATDMLESIELLAKGFNANVLGSVTKPLTEAKLKPLVALFRASLLPAAVAPAAGWAT